MFARYGTLAKHNDTKQLRWSRPSSWHLRVIACARVSFSCHCVCLEFQSSRKCQTRKCHANAKGYEEPSLFHETQQRAQIRTYLSECQCLSRAKARDGDSREPRMSQGIALHAPLRDASQGPTGTQTYNRPAVFDETRDYTPLSSFAAQAARNSHTLTSQNMLLRHHGIHPKFITETENRIKYCLRTIM
jgi:hypothetical protein